MSSSSPTIDMDPILGGKYPAKEHARRVAKHMTDQGFPKDGVIYLESAHTKMIEDNDEAMPFRQRRYFFYLSGCDLSDSYLTYNIPQDTLTLFIPPISPDSVIWSGLPLSPAEALTRYDIDDCQTSDQLNAALVAHSHTKTTTVYAIPDQVSDHVTFLGFASANFDILKRAIETSRVVKDAYEIALLIHANKISTHAHNALTTHLHTSKPATLNETQLWATFVGTCMSYGATEQAYHAIVASGRAAATLHYVHNDAPLSNKLNLLVDAGCEWSNYCADITRTVPISGSFSAESQAIYALVRSMQEECFKLLRAGVKWEDVHVRAHRVAIRGLLELGILKGAGDDEIFEKRVSVAFFPHGLGHYLGMDTHDCGGNPDYEDKDSMFRYLRVRGALPEGAVITVEPGIYFCPFIIDPVLADPQLSKYIDKDVLDKYWDVGGVRIEDDVLITKDGFQNLTDTPKL